MSKTIFDKILSKKIPADIVFEDEQMLAFKDISPQAPIHILIIPKKRIATINDIDESDSDLIGNIIIRAKLIAKEMGLADNGYRLVFNCNADGGQEVYHIHLHLLGGRKMTWPPG